MSDKVQKGNAQPSGGEVHVDGYGSRPASPRWTKGKIRTAAKAMLKSGMPPELVEGLRVQMKAERKNQRKARKARKSEWSGPVWKSAEQQILYGVVLQPDLRDSQGDIVSAAEIEKAAHRWLAEKRLHDVQHKEEQAPMRPVESWIAPQDMEIEGQQVTKGSWVMAIKVEDPQVWQEVKDGKLTGLSIGGSGIRVQEG